MPDDVDWAFVFRVDPNGTVSRVYSTIPDKRFVELAEGAPSSSNGITKGISPNSQVSNHHPINVSLNCVKKVSLLKFWIFLFLKNMAHPNHKLGVENSVTILKFSA